jgi:hypothetical protein
MTDPTPTQSIAQPEPSQATSVLARIIYARMRSGDLRQNPLPSKVMTRHERYNASAKGRARYARYDASAKGRARRARLKGTDKATARYKRYNGTLKGQIRRAWAVEKKLHG